MAFPLTAQDITIRPLVMADAGMLFEALAPYPDLCQFLTWNMPKTVAETAQKLIQHHRPNDLSLGVFLKNDVFIGRITLRNLRQQQQAAEKNSAFTSFWMLPPYEGQGYELLALKMICHYSFEDLGLRKILAGIFANNPLAQKVLEDAGFRLIGRLRKHYEKDGIEYDSLRYELLAEDASF